MKHGRTRLPSILTSLKRLKPELSKKYYVKKIGIFGSYARGEAGKTSDVDVLVDFSRSIDLFDFVALENYLSEKTGEKIDLVSAKAVREEFKSGILKEVVYI